MLQKSKAASSPEHADLVPYVSTACAHCLQGLVEAYSSSENLEVQGRACEYKRTFGHEAIRSQLFEHMPALDESTYTRCEPPTSTCVRVFGSMNTALSGQSAHP